MVTTTIETTVVSPSEPTSPPPTSLTPPSSTTTFSPNFTGVMQEPIATLFSFQSTEPEKTIHAAEADDDDVMVPFTELQFNPKEEDIPNEFISGGDRGVSVGSSKGSGEDTRAVVGKVTSMKNPTTIPMNPIITSSTTTTTTGNLSQGNVDQSKVQN
ncbi:unnamed protein product [Lactuca virosa]|uniref:Uncharacterized protein n=1 Tax=Lactuca virosa TaxID=75947 RepID=A0AAU9PX62_9ASTR|nr:unnamed protein product [Lactuca virosa]